MSNTELEIMRNAMAFLALYNAPPVGKDDNAVAWWADEVEGLSAIAVKWDNHPLVLEVLAAIHGYIEFKSKKKAGDLP